MITKLDFQFSVLLPVLAMMSFRAVQLSKTNEMDLKSVSKISHTHLMEDMYSSFNITHTLGRNSQ